MPSLPLCALWALAGVAAALPPLPSLLYYNESQLMRTRALLAANDSSVAPALAALMESLEKEILQGPWTVTSQTGAGPANTTNRTYVSIAPYWWPCVCMDPPDGEGCSMPPPPEGARPGVLPVASSKACNASTGLPWMQYDGVFNSCAIELYRSRAAWGNFTAHFLNATLGYALTGDGRLAAAAASWARVFFVDAALSMLPNLDHGQFIPGVTAGRGIGIIDFSQYCALGVLDGLLLLRGSATWSEADEAGVQAWMRLFLSWLLTSPIAAEEAATLNNHCTYYRALVQAVALYVGDRGTAASFAESDGVRVLDVQVSPDGELLLEEARTRSLHYVLFDLRAMQSLASTARRAGVELWGHALAGGGASRPAIAAALDFLAPFATGRAAWPHEQLDPFSMDELWDVYMGASVAYAERASDFAAVAAALVQAPRADDARRLLWPPAPSATPQASGGREDAGVWLAVVGGAIAAGTLALGVKWRVGTRQGAGEGEKASLLRGTDRHKN